MSAWTFTSATAWSACTSGQRTRNETWNRTITTQPSGGGAACGVTQEVRVVSEPCTVAATPTAQLTAIAGSTAGTANVTWQSTNATTATLNGVAVATSGTAQFTITATTTYTLVVTGPGGTASASGTVVVAPVDCVLSTWSLQSASPWGTCTGGQQTRTETWVRSIITPPSNGGAACGILQEQRTAAQTCTNQTPTAPGAPTSFKAATSRQHRHPWLERACRGRCANGLSHLGRHQHGVGARQRYGCGQRAERDRHARQPAPTTRASPPSTPSALRRPTQISFRVGAKKKPSRPAGFTASLQDSVAVLSWSAPAGDDPDSPTGYVIEAGSAERPRGRGGDVRRQPVVVSGGGASRHLLRAGQGDQRPRRRRAFRRSDPSPRRRPRRAGRADRVGWWAHRPPAHGARPRPASCRAATPSRPGVHRAWPTSPCYAPATSPAS